MALPAQLSVQVQVAASHTESGSFAWQSSLHIAEAGLN
jgi:hypothetical protein